MEAPAGIIENVIITVVPVPSKLVSQIAEKQNIPEDIVTSILRYNVLTPAQLSLITGLSIHTINTKLKPSVVKGEVSTNLDRCYPFTSDPGDVNSGSRYRFIYYNEKVTKLITNIYG